MKPQPIVLGVAAVFLASSVNAQTNSAAPSKADARLSACMDKLGPVYNDIQTILAKGIADKTIDPVEKASYEKAEHARKRNWAAKEKGGVTAAECEAYLQTLKDEKTLVARMAARPPAPKQSDPALGTCLNKIRPIYSSIESTMARGVADKSITPDEQAEFNKLEDARKKDWAAKAQGGVTVAECEAYVKALQEQKENVARMAIRPIRPPAPILR